MRRGWSAGPSGWILPFLLLRRRYALRRCDLRRYAANSARPMSRKKWAERKNTQLFGSASRNPGRTQEALPVRVAFLQPPVPANLHGPGLRGRSGLLQVSGAAPRAQPGRSREFEARPRSHRRRGHSARTVPHLPESPSWTFGPRNHPPRGRQITSAGGGAGAGSPDPPLRAWPVPPAPSASGGGASKAGRALTLVQLPR